MDKEYLSREEHEAHARLEHERIDATNRRIDDLKDSMNRSFSFWGIAIMVVSLLFVGMQIGIALVLYILAH